MSQFALVVKKIIDCPCQEVFKAWTKSEMINRWLFPNPNWYSTFSNKFKIGGPYKQEMISDDGTYTHTGVYQKIILDRMIVFTWNCEAVKDTLVTVELCEIEGKTEITLTHEFFANNELCEMYKDGWKECLENLAKLLSRKNYQCHMSYGVSVEKVYQAIATQEGLKSWWAQDCSMILKNNFTKGYGNNFSNKAMNYSPIWGIGSEWIFHFGTTFTVMKVKEIIPDEKVVWACIKHHHVDSSLIKTDEWVGTQIIFQLAYNDRGTDLQFTQVGLTPALECFPHCENRWNYFLKESLKSYLETGVGHPYR